MGLTFEHESISRALLQTGVAENYLERATVESEPTLPVCLGWSCRQSLMVQPEYAWLSLPEVSYVQLPLPLTVLIQKIETSSQSWHPTPEMAVLTMPLGQWQWAVNQLRGALSSGDKNEISSRLLALRRFAVKHWPGWDEKILHELIHPANASSVADSDLQLLSARANEVALLEACRPLLSWNVGGAKGEGLATLEDALAYMNQFVGGVDALTKLITQDPWWDEMEKDLLLTEKMLLQIKQVTGLADRTLDNRLNVLRKSLAQISGLAEVPIEMMQDKVPEACSAISTLIQTLGAIAIQRDKALVSTNL